MNKCVFISHSTKDASIATEICNILENHGISCWIAPRDIEPGSDYGTSIMQGIKQCQAFVLLFSRNSNSSKHVRREVERALGYEKHIVTYLLDGTPMNEGFEYYLASLQLMPAYPNYRDKTLELVQLLKKYSNKNDDFDILLSDFIEIQKRKDSTIGEKVKTILIDKLGIDESEVVYEASLSNDLGADELDTVELIMEFEKEFGIAIPDDKAEKICTVGDIIAYIESVIE